MAATSTAAAPASDADPACVQKREVGSVTRVVKVGIMGDGTVGKTTLLLAYVTRAFSSEYTPTTFDNFSAIEDVGGEVVNAILWDLAGQDDYSAVRSTCLKAVRFDALLLCFSVVHRDSFANVRYKWLPELAKAAGPEAAAGVPVVLAGCKRDLRVEGEPLHIAASEGQRRAKEIGARRYVECTAKEPETVREAILAAIAEAVAAQQGKR